MSEQNRSLLRGIDILKTFKPGIDLLGNGEIAERTQLSKATVSRLTQTLVSARMLEHDPKHRAYRLAAPVLSLAFAMKTSSPLLSSAAPKMRLCAEKHKVNIGLALADGDEMVYLESIRYNHKVAFRNVVAGLRVPMELTSLGHAWLSLLSESQRRTLFTVFKKRRPNDWSKVKEDIATSIEDVHRLGFCHASWQPGVLALSTPIQHPEHSTSILNISVSNCENTDEHILRLSKVLLQLKKDIWP
jgi:hypothetical protein